MTAVERFTKLLSTSFLTTLVAVIGLMAQQQWALALAAVLTYVVVDRLPQLIAVLKGVDAIAETFGLKKLDAFLDQEVAALESKLPQTATGLANNLEAKVQTPVADGLGKS